MPEASIPQQCPRCGWINPPSWDGAACIECGHDRRTRPGPDEDRFALAVRQADRAAVDLVAAWEQYDRARTALQRATGGLYNAACHVAHLSGDAVSVTFPIVCRSHVILDRPLKLGKMSYTVVRAREIDSEAQPVDAAKAPHSSQNDHNEAGPGPTHCPATITGRHQLRGTLFLRGRDDVRFPSGSHLRVQCKVCGRQGTAFLPDHEITWDPTP